MAQIDAAGRGRKSEIRNPISEIRNKSKLIEMDEQECGNRRISSQLANNSHYCSAKGTARQSRNRMEDRQNHGGTESCGAKPESWLTDHNRRGRMNLLNMILSCHDSVGSILRGVSRRPRLTTIHPRPIRWGEGRVRGPAVVLRRPILRLCTFASLR